MHEGSASEAGMPLRLALLCRLPFELGACVLSEIIARFSLTLTGAVELLSEPLSEGARSAADAHWAAYESNVKAAGELVQETDWSKVVKTMLRQLRYYFKPAKVIDLWRLGGHRLWRRLRASAGSRHALLEQEVETSLAHARRECDASKALFSAGQFCDAGARYRVACEMLDNLDASYSDPILPKRNTKASSNVVIGDNLRAELRAERIRVLVNMAVCHKKLGKHKEVLEYATRALSLEPEHVKALMLRGRALLATDDAAAALRDFHCVASLDPTNQEARAEVRRAAAAKRGRIGRERLLVVLAETAKRQKLLQKEISALARKLANEQKELMGAGEKTLPTKREGVEAKTPPLKPSHTSLSFLEAHQKVLDLGLSKDLLEDDPLGHEALQDVLLEFEDDTEVMERAEQLLRPSGLGDPQRAKSLGVGVIVEIHHCMVKEMQKALSDFSQLPVAERSSLTTKMRETIAELLVSIAVEYQFTVHSEDVEVAVMMHEGELQANPAFTRCSEQLSSMMQELTGSPEPRMKGEATF